MSNGADAQQGRRTPRQHVAELPVQWLLPRTTELRKTAGGAGEPGKEGGGWEEDLANMTSSEQLSASSASTDTHKHRLSDLSQHALCPGRVRAVETQSQSAAILINSHAHIFQEEQRIVHLL